MNQGFLVEIAGSHGTGKTTLSKHLEEHYKSRGETVLDYHVGEAAREAAKRGIKINEQGGDLSQCVIFSGVAKRLLEALYADGITFTDRSLVCPLAYSHALNVHEFILESQRSMVDLFYKKIKKKGVLFYIPIEFEIEDDGVRSVSEDFQKQVDEEIVNILKNYKIDYHTLTGSVDERVYTAIDVINGRR